MDDIFLKCDCSEKDHFVLLSCDDYEEDFSVFYITITKNTHLNFLGRLKLSFLYLFGLKNDLHDYREIVMNDDNINKLQKFIDEYNKRK